MLNFITGEKGSGKTALAHKIIGQAAERGERVMLIVPRQFSFESDKSMLSLLGPALASEVSVLSFNRLCDEVLKGYPAINKPIATAGIKSILMSLAIEAVGDSITVFAKHKNESALTLKLLASLELFKQSGITVQDSMRLQQGISDKLLGRKLREANLIFDAYETLLADKFFDESNLLSYVGDVLAATDYFEDKIIVIDGYSAFNAGELKIIEQMLLRSKELYVTLCIKKDREENELGSFAVAEKTMRRLRLMAGNNGIPVSDCLEAVRSDSYPAELRLLQERLFTIGANAYEQEPECISLMCASTRQKECDAVSACIKGLLREKDYRCRDIAVAFRSEGDYEKHLIRSFRKYKVPFFEDKRQPIRNQPLCCLAESLLEICSEGFDSDRVFRYLKTGLTGLSDKEISELENYTYAWDIDGGRWLVEWTGNPDGFGYEMNEQRRERLRQINLLRERAVAPVAAFREAVADCSGRKRAEELYNYLRDNKIDESLKSYALELEERGFIELALEQEQVWDFLMESLDELAGTIGDRHISCRRFRDLFLLSVDSKTLGKIPDGFDEVAICPAQRMLTKNVRVVFVLGLNSDVFPVRSEDNSIFSENDKLRLEAEGFGQLSDSKEHIAFERFLAYNTFCSATERLYLSYCRSDASEKDMTAGEYVEHIRELFPHIREVLSESIPLSEQIESEASAFEALAENWSSDSPQVRALREYFSEKEEYAGRLKSIENAVGKRKLSFEKEQNALDFFGDNFYFSASQLECYGNCAFQYFCRYGLNAMPRLRVRLDAAKTGTVVHDVLEKLLKKYKGKQFLELSPVELDKQIRELLEAYIESSMGGSESKSQRFNYLYFRFNKLLGEILERLNAEFSESDFEPCDFELEISRKGTVKPFSVELERGRADFYGIIDRVDKLDEDGKRYIRVVDYKTGFKEFRLCDVLAGLNMQMFLYLVSIWRNGEGFYEDIIPAGVLYFPAKSAGIKAKREEDSQLRANRRYGAMKMKGILLDDAQVIRSMDKKGSGLFIPVKYDSKTGEPKGELISLEALKKLAEHMDKIIKEMGDGLHKGRVPANPIMGAGHTNTCLYCDYGDICMAEKPEYRYIEPLSSSRCIEKLTKEQGYEQEMD